MAILRSASADMAPTAAQDEGGEGSGSQRRAGLRLSTRARGTSLPTATTPSTMVGLSKPPTSAPGRVGAAAKEQRRKATVVIGVRRVAGDAQRTTRNLPAQELDVAASASAASKRPKVGLSKPSPRRVGPVTRDQSRKESMVTGKRRLAGDAQRTKRNPPGQDLDAAAYASATSKRPEETGSRAGEEQSKKRKTAASEGCASEENAPRKSKRRCISGLEAEAEASASAATEHGSSAISSPLRRPYFKRDVIEVDSYGEETLEPWDNIDPAILDAYEEHDAKYCAKRRSQLKLVTLELGRHSCLGSPWFGPTRDSAAETVLKTAKFVLGLSSYIDGKLLKHASGFVIEWDEESKVATVLTSAILICPKPPALDEWLAKDEFAPCAEVHVRLLDKNDTITTARLIHYDKHFKFALFKIKMDLDHQIPSFDTDVKYGQEIFVLGRDEDQNLMVAPGSVLHKGPNRYDRHHTMFAGGELNESCIGGPVVESNGQFLGMISHRGMKFIPSAIILKCLHMLKKFDRVPRLHTGMKFSAIRFLDPVHREISRKCNIDAGLIVTEVSEGSIAEKVGIRIGDVVECWNGQHLSTTFELEELLLHMCEVHLDNVDNIGSDVEILLGIYRVRTDSRCTVILTLNVRDDVEVVTQGEYDVSTAMSAKDDQNSGHDKPHGTGVDEVGGS